MIRIFKFKKNDLNPSSGKQLEFSSSEATVFFRFKNPEETIQIDYIPLDSSSPLHKSRFFSTFKLSPKRGDYKCYNNPDGSINLKDFFLKKLNLTLDNNLNDFYALKRLSEKRYLLFYIPYNDNFGDILNLWSAQDIIISDSSDLNTEESCKSDEPLQVIYYGAPGTGKSFTIDDITDDKNSVRTTFHPDSDYASFVGAYKPTMAEVPMSMTFTSPKEGAYAEYIKKTDAHPGSEKKIVYKYVPQAFLKAYVAAWSNLDKPFYLIIEEINRGNCAQIFGDLFQLLDRNNKGCSSYAIHADEDISQFLKDDSKGFALLSNEQKAAISAFKLIKDNGKTQDVGQDILDGKLLLLPPNLHIWATMNTSDQSLFPIDSAFKRRWNWKYMPIEYHPIDKHTGKPIDWKFRIGENLYSWGEFLSKINPEIYSLTESSDKQMGYFFAKADPITGEISEDVFLNKVLFYLWTDVFKDYAMDSNVFRSEKLNRPFRFTDFFDDINHIKAFLQQLGIEPINNIESNIVQENENDTDNRDFSYYSIDGEGHYNKRQTVLQSLMKYVELNPTLSASDVIANWEEINPGVPNFIESETSFENRVAIYPDQRKRSWAVEVGDEKVYITNQWGVGRFDNFIKNINSSQLGVKIERVSE